MEADANASIREAAPYLAYRRVGHLNRLEPGGPPEEGARFSGCDLSGVGGVESLRGATVSAADAQSLVWALASAFGIRIEEDDGP